MKVERRVLDYVYCPMTGVQTDFSTLLKQFIDTGSVRYEQFAEIWRSMKMPLIFSGRQNDAEAREFTEDCLHIAKSFVFDRDEFQIQVGGLYLLYALYFKQVFEPRAKIRLTFDEWMQIQKLLELARSQSHYDVEYIFWRLRYANAFHFVAYPVIDTGMQVSSRVSNQDTAGESKYQTSDQGILLQNEGVISELTESDAIDQLKAIHEQYDKVKCAMAGPDAKKPQPSLSMIDSNIVQEFNKRIKQFESWKKRKVNRSVGRSVPSGGDKASSGSEDDSDSEKFSAQMSKGKNMGHIRAAIKEKAMKFSTEKSRSSRCHTVPVHSDDGATSETMSKPKDDTEDQVSEVTQPEVDFEMNPSNSQDGSLLSMPAFTELEENKQKKGKRRVRKRSPLKRKGSKMDVSSAAEENKSETPRTPPVKKSRKQPAKSVKKGLTNEKSQKGKKKGKRGKSQP